MYFAMKKVTTFMVIIVLSFAFTCLLTAIPNRVAWAAPGDSESNPILITNAYGLDNIRYDLSKHYKLANNVDMQGFLCPT